MVSIEDGIGGRIFEVQHVFNVHPHMNWPMRLHFQAAGASPALVPIPVANLPFRTVASEPLQVLLMDQRFVLSQRGGHARKESIERSPFIRFVYELE